MTSDGDDAEDLGWVLVLAFVGTSFKFNMIKPVQFRRIEIKPNWFG